MSQGGLGIEEIDFYITSTPLEDIGHVGLKLGTAYDIHADIELLDLRKAQTNLDFGNTEYMKCQAR
jgi:hypothetical protein